MKFTYCDTNTGAVSGNIDLIFPGFGEKEVLAVMSPHDDDAIIGAGYAMLAAQQAHVLEGMLMLLAYSLGLGIPFVLSAVLIDNLKTTFDWIKRNYSVINTISGMILVVIGVLMATGTFGRLLSLLS